MTASARNAERETTAGIANAQPLRKPGQPFRGDELRHILKGRDNHRDRRRKRTIQYSGEQSRILPRHGVRDAPQEPAIGLAEDETRGGA